MSKEQFNDTSERQQENDRPTSTWYYESGKVKIKIWA